MKIAQDINSVIGTVSPPPQISGLINKGGSGAGGLSFFLSQLVALLYIIAPLIFMFMIIFSALQWITAGGDKDKVASAQKRMTNAIIGLFLLAIAFVFFRVLGGILNFPLVGS